MNRHDGCMNLYDLDGSKLTVPNKVAEGSRGRGAEPASAPFGRRTDAVRVLLISQNGTVLYGEC